MTPDPAQVDVAELRAERDAAVAQHRDLVSRLGFGDNITEPMADNDMIVKWYEEQSRDANEWQEWQLWRNDCYVAGHPDDEDCYEHDPNLRLAVAEQWLARAEAAEAEVEDLRAKVAAVEALADECADHPATAECADDDGWRCAECTHARAIRAALETP